MDYRLIPERLPDSVKTEYLLRDMPLCEVVLISREALRNVDYGTRNTSNIELWVRDEYDKQGNIEYLKHIINRGKLWYPDILKAFKRYNSFFDLDPGRPIDWLDTLMRENKKEEIYLTDDFEYNPAPRPILITNPRWEHIDEERAEESPDCVEFDDKIMLKADVENLAEGGDVIFTIYDTSEKPPRKVTSVNGKNRKKIGSAEWVFSDKNGKRSPKLEFDASAASRVTVRCPIPLEQIGYYFSA